MALLASDHQVTTAKHPKLDLSSKGAHILAHFSRGYLVVQLMCRAEYNLLCYALHFDDLSSSNL